MVIKISPLRPDDVDGAITCIQQAFASDPYYLWVFDRYRFSLARNRASLRARCLWGMKHALFHVAKDVDAADGHKVLGIGCWLTPALAAPAPPPPSWTQYLLSCVSATAWTRWLEAQQSVWELWFAQLATNVSFWGRGGLITRRYYIWKAAQAAAQQQLWDDPAGYYFCNIVTVLPEAQGRGVGRALMEHVLKRADAEGRRCYLESSRDVPNVEIYSRMGFEVRREMRCEEGGDAITLFCMVREPVR